MRSIYQHGEFCSMVICLKKNEGEVMGIYETVMQVVYGLAIIVAGFVGEIFGFEWTLFFAEIFTILSSIVLLTVHRKIKRM